MGSISRIPFIIQEFCLGEEADHGSTSWQLILHSALEGNDSARLAVAWLLAMDSSPTAFFLLCKAAVDRTELVRFAALRSINVRSKNQNLPKMDPNLILLSLTRSPRQSLVKRVKQEYLNVYRKAWKNWKIPEKVVQGFYAFGIGSGWGALLSALTDSCTKVRKAAIETLVTLVITADTQKLNRLAFSKILDILLCSWSTEKDSNIRIFALEGISHILAALDDRAAGQLGYNQIAPIFTHFDRIIQNGNLSCKEANQILSLMRNLKCDSLVVFDGAVAILSQAAKQRGNEDTLNTLCSTMLDFGSINASFVITFLGLVLSKNKTFFASDKEKQMLSTMQNVRRQINALFFSMRINRMEGFLAKSKPKAFELTLLMLLQGAMRSSTTTTQAMKNILSSKLILRMDTFCGGR
eukprot:g4547.t1